MGSPGTLYGEFGRISLDVVWTLSLFCFLENILLESRSQAFCCPFEILMASQNVPEPPRALTYTEMMNEGCQYIDDDRDAQELSLQARIEELERRVQHLENVIRRQIRLGRMKD